MELKTKKFNIIAPVQKSVFDPEADALYIEGIANSGNEDLVGDIVTQQALESIVEQATTKNLHLEHEKGKDNILGPIVESELVSEGAWIKAKIINEQKEWLKSYLEQGVFFGQSISGVCTYADGSNSEIVDWELTEISLTDTPCDPMTMGTVSMSKSFDDCIIVAKNHNKEIIDNMEEDNMADEPVYMTEEDVTKIINDAFNERKEEFLETIRDEIKSEYDAVINELKEKIDALEAPEEKPEGEEAPEQKADDEEKPEGEEEPEEEEEEEEKGLTDADIQAIVDAKIKSIFEDVSKNVDYKYDSSKSAPEGKETYTAKELAEMGII